MPRDLLGATTYQITPGGLTEPRPGQDFIAPTYEGARWGTSDEMAARASTLLDKDGLKLLDGSRLNLVDPISSSEKAKLYAHEVSSRLDVLQSWEGIVTEIKPGEFTARLYDLTDANAEESEAVFDLHDVSDNDRDLLKIGAVFRWMIGYRRHSYGQQERVSAIVFRRLPTWYESDLDDAEKYGEALAGAISIDRGVQPPTSDG